MNERNVAALEELLQIASPRYNDPGERLLSRALAIFLTSRGVLVPSALTVEQATHFPFDGEFLAIVDADLVEPAKERRAALERIAKGEP